MTLFCPLKTLFGNCGILERFRSRNLSLSGPQLSSQWERSAVASQVSVCICNLFPRVTARAEGVLMTQSLFSVVMSFTCPPKAAPNIHLLSRKLLSFLADLGELGSYFDMCVCRTKIVSLEAGLYYLSACILFFSLPAIPSLECFISKLHLFQNKYFLL